jgi:hypothetical protein
MSDYPPNYVPITDDDKAFIERHARDWWLTQVEKNERMARTYGFWFRLMYGDMDLRDVPDHNYAVRQFRDEIPLI